MDRLNKIQKPFKKSWIVFLLLLALLAVLVAFFLKLKPEAVVTNVEKPTIALVNNDMGGSFHETSYTFGKQFVDLVSGDDKYNWVVVSQSVAKNAYENESIDAVIYLPQTFSADILTFQNLSPQSAAVEYMVRQGSNELSNYALNQKIRSILNDFNQNVVKMYYASVAGNVADAVTNMDKTVGNQTTILTGITEEVLPQLTIADKSYASVVEISDMLQQQNTAWIDQQNNFTVSTQDMLKSIGESLSGELPELTDYFDLQRTISSTNLTNANQGIQNQFDSDTMFYYNRYTDFYLQGGNILSTFNTSTDPDTPDPMTVLNQTIADYNNTISEIKDDLQEQHDELITQKQTLQALEQTLLLEYFSQTATEITVNDDTYLTPDNTMMSAGNAKTALAKKVANSFQATNNLSDHYGDSIEELLSLIPSDQTDLRQYCNELHAEGLLSAQSLNQYEKALELVSNYNMAFGGANGSFQLMLPDNTTNQTATKTLPLTVPAGKSYTITLASSQGSTLTIDMVSPGGNISSSTVVLDNSSGTADVGYRIQYTVNLGSNPSETVTATLNDPEQSVYTDTFTLAPGNITDTYAGQNLEAATNVMSRVTAASNLIVFLYGAPAETVGDLADKALTSPDAYETNSEESVYQMYGNMTADSIAQRLSEQDITAYQTSGSQTVSSVIEAITDLMSAADAIQTDIDTLSNYMPTDYLTTAVTALNTWYDQAKSVLDEVYQTIWQENGVITLNSLPWEEAEEQPEQIYYDEQVGETLYESISALISSSSEQADNTAESAALIEDNSSSFDTLVESTTATQNDAKKGLDNTDTIISTGSTAAAQSNEYNENFSTLLANTRASGADTGSIYDFFANPLTFEDTTPKVRISQTNIFDWHQLLVLFIGITLGLILSSGYKAIRGRKQSKL